MLLGKRPRRPVRRTTSMSGFSSDILIVETHHQLEREPEAKDTSGDENSSSRESANCSSKRPQQKQNYGYQNHHHQNQNQQQAWSWDGLNTRYNLTAMVSPRNPGTQFGRFPVETTAHFLKACGLCNRRLAPGRDIFMYRGEIAFCSSECRQQQMSIDERKEKKKCSLTSIKNDPSPTTASAPATSDGSGSGSGNETTIAAA